jgi:hypothetical protein
LLLSLFKVPAGASEKYLSGEKMGQGSAKVYEVGTLRYSFGRLMIVCFWMLWGLLWYDMVQYIMVPTLIPLNFKALNASGEWMGVVLGSLPSLANFFLNRSGSLRIAGELPQFLIVIRRNPLFT